MEELKASKDNVELKEWQQDLLDRLLLEPNPRKIYWYYDPDGGNGKSFMANYLVSKLNALVITHGKLADLTYAYDSEPIVVVDLARIQADKIDHMYQFMEDLKNGRVFSTKYESRNKYFKSPHVVCFANFVPNPVERLAIWSADRWCIHSLEPEVTQDENILCQTEGDSITPLCGTWHTSEDLSI